MFYLILRCFVGIACLALGHLWLRTQSSVSSNTTQVLPSRLLTLQTDDADDRSLSPPVQFYFQRARALIGRVAGRIPWEEARIMYP
ncbi:hypothetical protein B0T18DRAFT_40226 [Schizothecium vesticola]|uniref:Secreted protein n=1 Tax=Schizothecium vesticola TaxID=314040 RepID=A0AA40KD84_9PEZI|nr:hypothetical protein B0T18DRAFT_40226 [Schizothecium vesticola]